MYTWGLRFNRKRKLTRYDTKQNKTFYYKIEEQTEQVQLTLPCYYNLIKLIFLSDTVISQKREDIKIEKNQYLSVDTLRCWMECHILQRNNCKDSSLSNQSKGIKFKYLSKTKQFQMFPEMYRKQGLIYNNHKCNRKKT